MRAHVFRFDSNSGHRQPDRIMLTHQAQSPNGFSNFRFTSNSSGFSSIYGLLRKLCRMLSLFGYQSQSSSSASCSMHHISSSKSELETASWKPLRTKASDHSENVQKVCKPANNS